MKQRREGAGPRGSWRWAQRVAELISIATAFALLITLHALDVGSPKYYLGVFLVVALLAVGWLYFRLALDHLGRGRRAAWLGLAFATVGTFCAYALLRGESPSPQLFFVPAIIAAGLLGNIRTGLAMAVISIVGYLGLATVLESFPRPIAAFLNSVVFVFTGYVSGLLSEGLRTHYRGEMEEHRLAMVAGYRLTSVMGAVEEAIVFSDRQGRVKVLNRRATELFEIEQHEYLDKPVVQLHRHIARLSEDPEGFMERFQQLRDEPEAELQFDLEQIIPARRVLRGLSRPAKDPSGALVGRIDVYTDVSEEIRRAAEVERLYEQARTTAESYQRALLPRSTPSVPRVSLVAHYIPAAGRRAVCGDFYDFLTLPDGRIGIALGDVCGAGPSAVADAALTRYTISSLIRAETDPGELFNLSNGHVFQRLESDRFVRVVLGILDPERAVLTYANAGHVPPLLFRARTGEVEWLGEGGLPLGVELGAEYKAGRIELEPGDTLLFYTDGVNEAPRLGRPLGQGKLKDLVGDYGVGTPGELVQAVRRAVESWVDGELRDDLAMVGVQVVPDTMEEPTRELVLPNEPQRMREIRSFVADFLADLRAPVDVSSDILLAIGEAAGNAVRYGRKEEGRSEIRVLCVLDGVDVIVTIADEGPGFDLASIEARGLPDPFASGGRGLFLMRQLMDRVDFLPTRDGTTVVLARQAFTDPPLPPKDRGES
jgi:serine phosphatase RsbU (regulator of sigma subunit)/anti-sigma regulatory factor (Ser/Thr protein kinase)